jgi:plasmid replication initiation protein
MINSNEQLFITEKFEVTARDFAKIYGIDERGAYDQLLDVAKSLHNRKITIQNNKIKVTTSWISGFIEYKDNSGKIGLWFSQPILPYLSELKNQFTRYDLSNVSGMSSIYGIRLYELLMQWQMRGNREVEIAWLKEIFEIENNYTSISDLKKYVIEPAVKNVNNYSNLDVLHNYKKTGRNVTHIHFKFKEKEKKKKSSSSTRQVTNLTTVESNIDNLEHFAQIRKRFGDAAAIPQEFIDILKSQGRW